MLLHLKTISVKNASSHHDKWIYPNVQLYDYIILNYILYQNQMTDSWAAKALHASQKGKVESEQKN